MIHTNIPLAQAVIELCKEKGIRHVAISPGSRNAPLTIGFTHDPYFTCYSVVDERSAAFFALGIAQRLREPTAVVCTSGSAVLNYYPAIAEAYYSNIPLVVLSADRPEHLIGIGDGQTINQENVFANHILYSANLRTIPDTFRSENEARKTELVTAINRYNEKEIREALSRAKHLEGPVHLNIPFNEPLYGTTESKLFTPQSPDSRTECENALPDLGEFIQLWNQSYRKMVLVGVLPPNSVSPEWLEQLAEDPSVLVFTETTSNLHHRDFFPNIDKIIMPLSETGLKKLQPDILLTFGGMVISKKIKAVLRNYPPEYHWHVGPHRANDTFFRLSDHFTSSPEAFLSSFLPAVKPRTDSEYKPYWKSVDTERNRMHSNYLNEITYSDFTVFDSLVKSLPGGISVQVSNSSTIRYMQLFKMPADMEVFCNRGTSGIDGSTSTAVGFASVNEKPTVLVTGDLSFFYDSNGLWNKYIPPNFKIILINNGGGGIFRILPGDKNTENFDDFFETTHELKANHLCKMYGLNYHLSEKPEELKPALESFFRNESGPALLEITTPRTYNDKVLLNYFKHLGMEEWKQQ